MSDPPRRPHASSSSANNKPFSSSTTRSGRDPLDDITSFILNVPFANHNNARQQQQQQQQRRNNSTRPLERRGSYNGSLIARDQAGHLGLPGDERDRRSRQLSAPPELGHLTPPSSSSSSSPTSAPSSTERSSSPEPSLQPNPIRDLPPPPRLVLQRSNSSTVIERRRARRMTPIPRVLPDIQQPVLTLNDEENPFFVSSPTRENERQH